MSIDVGEVVATLRADTSQFTGGIDSANKKLDGLAKGMTESSASLNTTGLGLVSIGGKITATAAAMGALGVAAAKELGSFSEEVGLLSQKFGVSQESIQVWNFALNRVGMSASDLGGGFKKLSSLVTAAFGGDDKAIKKIEHLGVSLDDLRGKNPEQIFLTLAGAIAKIDDPLQRNAALTSTFGKAGMGLVPILSDVSDGFTKSGEQARALGLVLGDKTLASAQALDDSFDDLGATMAGFSRTIATTFQGPLKDVITVLTEMLGAFNVWWQGIDAGTKKVVLIFAGAFAASGPIIATIGAFMVAVSAGLGPLMIGGAIVTGLVAAITAIIVNWEAIKAKGVAIWTGVRDGIIKLVTETYEGIKKYLTDKLMAIVAPVQKFADDVYGIFFTLKDKLVGHSVIPDTIEEIGDNMRMLDTNMVAPARTAATGTFRVFRELAGKMTETSVTISNTMISVWANATSSMSNAMATQLIMGNDWKNTMNSLAVSALSAVINLGAQLLTQEAVRLASHTATLATHQAVTLAAATSEVGIMQAKNVSILAGETATAGGVVSIWTSTSSAVVGAFGLMSASIAAFFAETIIPMFAAVGEVVMTFLSAMATSLDISIFGAAFSVPVWAAVGLMAAAVGAISAFAFGAFAEGGVVTKPTMALMGEAGPEAIIPLDKLGQFGGGGATTVVVELDGRQIAKSVFNNMPGVMRLRGMSA